MSGLSTPLNPWRARDSLASSSSGKGKSSSPSVAGRGKGKPKKGFGPCLIGGKPGHSYAQCPDRFSKGKSEGKSFAKGNLVRATRKRKVISNYDVHLNVLTAEWGELASNGRALAIIDTGATENAVGVGSLRFSCSVCNEDLPPCRFGNGHRDRHLAGWILVDVSFNFLGGQGGPTPPLGCRHCDSVWQWTFSPSIYLWGIFVNANARLWLHGHVTIDFAEHPIVFDGKKMFHDSWHMVSIMFE